MNRAHIHAPAHIGERIADMVVTGMGSWRFVIIQTVIVAVWIVLNAWLLTHPFDPYPMILLNLIFSTQAAYASPLILMAANRQSVKDRKRDDLEASEVEQLFSSHELLLQINQQQLEILQLLRDSKGDNDEETEVCDDRQAQERSNSTIRRSGEDEAGQASQASVGISLSSYLAQMPDHPLAREIRAWVTSLGQDVEHVTWWEIHVSQIAWCAYKAQVSLQFTGSATRHYYTFPYDEREVSK